MIRIEKFFLNHFDTDRIGDDRMKAFSEDHVNKLTAYLSVHVNPDYSALLAQLVTDHNGYFGAITDEKIKFNIQQGRTIAVDNAWDAVLAFIRQQEGTVRGIWGKTAPEYQEFYPNGLDEYNHATKPNKATLLTQYLNAATVHNAELPATFVADFTALKTDWNNKFTSQQTQIGLVKDANSQTALSRDPVELQLSRNILAIAFDNVGHPEMVNDFFNQSLLEPASKNLPKEGTTNPGETKLAVDLGSYDPDFELKMTNVSGGPQEFSLSQDGSTPIGNSVTIAAAGASTTYKMSDFGVVATIVLVHNQGSVVSQWRLSRG